MKKALYIAILFFFTILTGVSAQNKKAKASSTKPNIIFILADDLGIGDLSCYGSDNNKTPIIDQLAKSGMQFKNGYTAPLCGPSRSRILTGRYAFRTGAVNQDRVGEIKPENEVMIPSVLKAAGYTSAMVGKWSQMGLTPKDFGFDDYITFQGSGVYWSKEKKKAATYTENGEEKNLNENVYMPDLMHNHLVKFLEDNKKKPFFLYYSMVHVHSLIQPTPDSKPGSDLYADNTAYMDKLVGKLLATLEDKKLRENTLIVFMGDNGTASIYAERGSIGGKALSGKKGSMLECGSLVPTIASWPAVIKAGQINTDLIDSSDLLPTFAAVTGAPLPTKNPLDGRSFLPQLQGKKGDPKEYIFMELGNKWYVRSAKWKLNREGEFFDMTNAPFEEKRVADYANNTEASAAYTRLQTILKEIAPEKGIQDDGDGSGRHASNVLKRKAGKEAKDSE